MAGDWIKLEKETLRKPEILKVASNLSIHPDQALGLVLRFWAWVDGVSSDGRIAGIDAQTLDSSLNCPGLAAALVAVDWLRATSHGFSVPRFERHMGASAKRRLLAREKKRRQRNGDTEGDTEGDIFGDEKETTSSLSLNSSPPQIQENGVRPPMHPPRPRSDLPCDNPEKFPAARTVVDYFQKLHPHHSRGKGIEVVIGRLNDGETEARLKAAADGYATSCRAKGIEPPRRISSAVFFSAGGEWERHAAGPVKAEGLANPAYLKRKAEERKQIAEEEAKAADFRARKASGLTRAVPRELGGF